MIPKLAKISMFLPKNGIAKCTKENKGEKMEFSQNIYSYCDYVVALDVEVHGHHMDIIVISQGYHKVLQGIKCSKLLRV
jgi:hypothetical protein